jgi:hypothetical protein
MFPSFHESVASGFRDGIFNAGWWNNEQVMDGWDYGNSELNVMP